MSMCNEKTPMHRHIIFSEQLFDSMELNDHAPKNVSVTECVGQTECAGGRQRRTVALC